MLDGFIRKVVLGWCRHGISALAGYLIAAGYITSDQGPEVTGAAMVLISLLLSVADKLYAKQELSTATRIAAEQAAVSK